MGPSSASNGLMVDQVFDDVKQLRGGFKVYVSKEGEKRLAEILSTSVRKGHPVFYVHYEGFNKRLDEWVSEDRIDLSRPVSVPSSDGTAGATAANNKKAGISGRNVSEVSSTVSTPKAASPAPPKHVVSSKPSKSNSKTEVDLDDIRVNEAEEFDTREDEIEKLRTSGSMTQNSHEVSRVRNIMKLVMGRFEIEPWYFSPYPVELTEEDEIYIDEFSLSYFGSKRQFERFRQKSTLRHPPGNEIYRDGEISFFEIDGRQQRTWCRNLCLLSKLFLDHKTLYYDVDPFLFYCMTKRDETGFHLVGYFSKEKESAEGYNVACILTLPQYQRHGYGRVLIDFSYNLSKREGKVGSPEKPLSDLGLLSYRAYWAATIVELLAESDKPDTTIEEISSATAMTTTDILHTLQTLNMLKYYKGQHIICLTDAVSAKFEKQKLHKRVRIDPAKLIWKPPVFTAAQLRFAW